MQLIGMTTAKFMNCTWEKEFPKEIKGQITLAVWQLVVKGHLNQE